MLHRQCWVLRGMIITCQDFVRKEVSGYKRNRTEFVPFYSSRVQHSESLLCSFCALWQCECLPLLLVTKTLAICSNWDHAVALHTAIRVLQSLECIGCFGECEILHLGAFMRGPDWRKFLILHWQVVAWDQKNKFKLNRNVYFREQRVSLVILLDDGAPFAPGVVELYLIRTDPDTHGTGKGGSKLSSLDLEQCGRSDIASIRSPDRADLISPLAAKIAWAFRARTRQRHSCGHALGCKS